MVWHLSDLSILFLFNQKEKNSYKLLIKNLLEKKKLSNFYRKKKGKTLSVTFRKPKLIKPCNRVTTVKSDHFNHFIGPKLSSFVYKNKYKEEKKLEK